MTTVLGGILGSDPIDWQEVDRRREAERKRDQDYAEREQALQRTLDDIEDSFKSSPYLRERAMKRAAAELTLEIHKTFLKFQTFCAAWGLPCLPETKPQAIALFLAQESKDGPDARRLLNRLSTVYKKLNPQPWDDPLVLAIADASRDDDVKKIEMH